jgi:predicted dehydrogenase
LQIFGSKGIVEYLTGYLPAVSFLPDPGWSPGRSGAKWQKVTSAGVGKPEPITPAGIPAGNVAAITDLLAAIREDRQPLCGVYAARSTIEMIMAVFESQRQGRPVTFPLENRKHPLSML